jgi:pyruvate,water dikinase
MPDVVRNMIADFSTLDDSQSPRALGDKQARKYLDTLARVPKKLHSTVARMRSFLWWREEFRDISTRSNYVIRKLTLALGRAWEKDGTLQSAEDIFFLPAEDIEAGETQDTDRNKKYYASFVNFQNPNELGNRHGAGKHTKAREGNGGAQCVKGIPCSGESVTATARVIKDIHEAYKIEQGEILVTRCTDPAWTALFIRLGGVITETGGMLSHAAVVSREYGLPCILMAKNATETIRDGDVLTMDCKTGEIHIREKSIYRRN